MVVLTRRTLLGAIATSPLWITPAAAGTTRLKISHQFPVASLAEGDFRDRLCRRFVAEVERRTRGTLKFAIHANGSLAAPQAQFGALASGALDLALVPLSYASAALPEAGIGLLPGLVTSYAQGYGWKDAAVGKELTGVLAERGVMLLSWIWQAGGVASRSRSIVNPEDVRGLTMRGGSPEMDHLLAAAGARINALPSNQIHRAMASGALDAAVTSSTSLISFRLHELARQVTTARGGAYWFMLEPLLMSQAAFERLTRAQQDAVLAVGAELETFARRAAQADDAAVAAVYQDAGARATDLNPAALRAWQELARQNTWKAYAARSPGCARMLALAENTV